MIDKKILWLSGSGAVALSVAIAVTINVVIKTDTVDKPSQSPGQLSCSDLQQAIDNLGRPGWIALPQLVADNITWLRMQGDECNLQGKDWLLANGQIKIKQQEQKTIIGDEGNILGGIK